MHTGLFGSPLDTTRLISPREEKCESCRIQFCSVCCLGLHVSFSVMCLANARAYPNDI